MKMITAQLRRGRVARSADPAARRKILRRFLPSFIAAFLLAISASVAAAKDGNELHHRKTVDGMIVYLGVIPAAIVRGHASEHAESKMHGGVPTGSQMQHVVIALFDSTSGERVENAKLKASVGSDRHGCGKT